MDEDRKKLKQRFGKNLRQLLRDRNLSPYEFSLTFGMSSVQLKKLLDGKSLVRVMTLYEMSEYFEVSMDYFFRE